MWRSGVGAQESLFVTEDPMEFWYRWAIDYLDTRIDSRREDCTKQEQLRKLTLGTRLHGMTDESACVYQIITHIA